MSRIKNAKGFTLLEVLIAVIIASISFAGVYATSTQCLKHIWAAREVSRATMAADYEVEKLRTAAWSNITALGSSYTVSATNNPAFALLSGGSGTVRLDPLTGNTNAMQATVTLTWASRTGSLNTNMVSAVLISKNDFLR